MNYSNYVILNYDLGIRGAYDDLYTFLDSYGASDCGNSNSFFEFPFKGAELTYEDKFNQLIDELDKTITFSKTDRIYVIVHSKDGKPRGKFIFGQRKTPVWDGYAKKEEESDLPF
jgi:hypothetical protein